MDQNVAASEVGPVDWSAFAAMARSRRYDAKNLAASLASVGWHPELIVPYAEGADGQPTMALMLFRKK